MKAHLFFFLLISKTDLSLNLSVRNLIATVKHLDFFTGNEDDKIFIKKLLSVTINRFN